MPLQRGTFHNIVVRLLYQLLVLPLELFYVPNLNIDITFQILNAPLLSCDRLAELKEALFEFIDFSLLGLILYFVEFGVALGGLLDLGDVLDAIICPLLQRVHGNLRVILLVLDNLIFPLSFPEVVFESGVFLFVGYVERLGILQFLSD